MSPGQADPKLASTAPLTITDPERAMSAAASGARPAWMTETTPAPPAVRSAPAVSSRTGTPRTPAVDDTDPPPRFARRLSVLPKPILFGLCGGGGGLLAALLVGEIMWQLTRPGQFTPGRELQLAVPASLRVYVGGKNHFLLRVARRGFTGPVRVEAVKPPPGLFVAPFTLAPDQEEASVEVNVRASLPAGQHRLVMRGAGPPDPESLAEPTMDGELTVNVEPVPPRLRMVVAPELSLFSGGKGRFKVLVGRDEFDEEVSVAFQGAPVGVTIPRTLIAAGKTEAEVEASVARNAAPRRLDITAVARALVGNQEVEARGKLVLDVKKPPAPKADILFVVDLTSSMAWAISGITDGIGQFVRQLEGKDIDARIGFIGFCDIVADREEPFILQFDDGPFTADREAFARRVKDQRLRGGGDNEESAFQALFVAARQPFRPDAARVLVLITDAPPKRHPGIPPADMAETIKHLAQAGIAQVHLVVHEQDRRDFYGALHRAFKGEFLDIQTAVKDRGLARLLPDLGDAIGALVVAKAPAALAHGAGPPLLPAGQAATLPPAEAVELVQAVQATEAFSQDNRNRLLLALALWTAVMAAGISVAILAGEQAYLRQAWLEPTDTGKALAGGLFAGVIGGVAAQWLFQAAPDAVPWLGSSRVLASSRVLGWGILGGVIGAGASFFVPNLRWYRGLLGGAVGGVLGALAFIACSNHLGALLGRWLGAAILGFCIGLMVALAELVFRRYWLEITFGAREVRTVTLGAAPVTVGGDERLATVFVQGAPALALSFHVVNGCVLCQEVGTGPAVEMAPGETRKVAGVTVAVCSVATARASGFALQFADGKRVELMVGMPLTREDIPSLQPQRDDGIVALLSTRPNDPRTLLLRNRSAQTWTITSVAGPVGGGGPVRGAGGGERSLPPGAALEMTTDYEIRFGDRSAKLARRELN
jgi:Ca-activated chloride channel family protein